MLWVDSEAAVVVIRTITHVDVDAGTAADETTKIGCVWTSEVRNPPKVIANVLFLWQRRFPNPYVVWPRMFGRRVLGFWLAFLVAVGWIPKALSNFLMKIWCIVNAQGGVEPEFGLP